MDATLSLDGQSVAIPLVEEGGEVLIARDLGKPETNLRSTGALFPRSQDQWSGLQNLTLVGRFTGSSAYDKARTLFDIVESDFGNDELTLDVPLSEYPSNMTVALSAGSDQACSVTYPPGRKTDVGVSLNLTRVGRVLGTGDRSASTPTATGTGPIEYRAGGATTEITRDVTVERTCGRPNDVVRAEPGTALPYYINKPKSVTEVLSLSFEFADNPVAQIDDIVSTTFEARFGRSSVTLDFNGVFGLGEFSVMPVGSAPFRHARRAGYEGQSRAPTLNLSRVYSG